MKRAHRGIAGNHYDLVTGEEYWVSGVKKRGVDRHWAGSGKVAIERSAVPEYLEITGAAVLDTKRFEEVQDFPKVYPAEFVHLENAKLEGA